MVLGKHAQSLLLPEDLAGLLIVVLAFLNNSSGAQSESFPKLPYSEELVAVVCSCTAPLLVEVRTQLSGEFAKPGIQLSM